MSGDTKSTAYTNEFLAMCIMNLIAVSAKQSRAIQQLCFATRKDENTSEEAKEYANEAMKIVGDAVAIYEEVLESYNKIIDSKPGEDNER